ncbi:GNAT family N-acetyltransferase [Pseudoalteromonas sp. MMG013]|uniref:GNAT family N-acetyltransferase n=1 Tax=Pseudoalteromonas sp. MMG013 TaxID=2822687 RepID=UPI001B36F1A1|nr:N-acetyltransferase [Pseudoalteromonas sp. MMG013]MBQ4863117.1 GNAT family N-acetyltransferase [Pseudoalteromonas sp. MMG013]
MIEQLNHSQHSVASQIYGVFQDSYKIEAALIGTIHFPPLSRSVQNIESATTLFYGYFEANVLAAVIEISVTDTLLSIESLTVSPQFFRKGIAHKLLNFIISTYQRPEAIVETAAVNTPAINLYRKQGFIVFKTWTPAHGIEKVAMLMKKGQST